MWKNININKNMIRHETGTAVLIAMPHNSEWDGYVFWHPAKLVRSGRHSNAVSIGYTDSFTFRLKKYGKGKYNQSEVIDEENIGAEEFEEAFGLVNDNISAPAKKKEAVEVHIPDHIEAQEHEALEELRDDE